MYNNKSQFKHSIFSVYGIEIEYMIVNKDTLEICPFTDKLFNKIQGSISNEILRGEIALNNELTLHVLELKTNGPKSDLSKISDYFNDEIVIINAILAESNLVLMPSAMHPWAKTTDIELWPHGDRTIYNTYHQIFDCNAHGWANLQSTHLNLPFGNESEFVQLHQAIRLIIPLIPALAASSPFTEGKLTEYHCSRMYHYENNQKSIPMITGHVVPESISSINEYHQKILEPMYEAIAPKDVNKILQYEWLNSRGAITRFERDAIEIRVIDSQECPLADLSIVSAIVAALKYVIDNTEAYLSNPIDEKTLKNIMDNCVRHGLAAKIDNDEFLQQINLPPNKVYTAKEVWSHLISLGSNEIPKRYQKSLDTILTHGSLAERLIRTLNKSFTQKDLKNTYNQLIDCLQNNQLFI